MGDLKSFDDLRAEDPGIDTIWLDGEFVDWADATTHVLAHGIHYGTGIFEGVRCYDTENGPQIFRWDAHLERLFRSAKPLGIEIPFSRDELTQATRELIRQQALDACYIRPIVFYGYDKLGISPDGVPVQTAIAAWPLGTYLGEAGLEDGVDVAVSSWRRYGADQVPTTMKATGAYVNSVLASREARATGYDEAILLNPAGNVAEGPGENLFLVEGHELYTPGLAEGVLPGITRETVIRLARDIGYTVHDDATISRGQLVTADELFFCGTAAEVTPIRTVDGVSVGEGSRGPITEAIQARFFDVVERQTAEYDAWFTPVGPETDVDGPREVEASPGR